MSCANCGKETNFLLRLGDDKDAPLCLDCYHKFIQTIAIQKSILERETNYLSESLDRSLGIPGLTPKYPERQMIHLGDITLNNIKIDKSNVGVINIGTIGIVDVALTVLKEAGENSIAHAIQSLTEATIANKEAEDEVKQQILEILSVLGEEATRPKENRRSAAMKRLLVELSTIISGVGSLAQLWEQIGHILQNFF